LSVTHFLRKMIRLLLGTLVEIGAGMREPSGLVPILKAKNRKAAGICAPARGLSLVKVIFSRSDQQLNA